MLTTLQGLKVLDFGLYFAGPYASRLLADLGADVIKVEALDGDTLRPTTKPFNAAAPGKRSSRSISSRTRPEVAHRIAARADVVTHNMRPGVAERPGWATTPSGPSTPRSSTRTRRVGEAADPTPRGVGSLPSSPDSSGCTTSRRARATSRPRRPGNEDNGNGLLGAAAILFALDHRAQTGEGQYLEHPQLNATMLMGLHLMRGCRWVRGGLRGSGPRAGRCPPARPSVPNR